MRGYVFLFLMICGNVAPSYAEGLPANPWAKAATQTADTPAVSVVSEHPTANEAQDAANLNPYLINLQENLQQADIQNRIGNALQSLENINENPYSRPNIPSGADKLPSWQGLLPQADLSSFMPKASSQKQATQPAVSSGNDEFSKAVSDIEKQYNKLKRTTNSYYRGAVRNAHELEKNAKDSVNKLQNMLK